MKAAPLMERIQRNSVHVGDCWDWKGFTINGTPIIRLKVDGEWTSMPVRRAILAERGEDTTGMLAHYSCRNQRCVNPAHTVRKPIKTQEP